MKRNKLFLSLFVIVALVQISLPAKMILDMEDVINNGREFHFETAPIDPNDPFRGKYIDLNFTDDFILSKDSSWMYGDEIYVSIRTGDDGFAEIEGVSRTEPQGTSDYIKTQVSYFDTEGKLYVEFPFDVYYMEESKAGDAEDAYRDSRSSEKPAFALVRIKDGNFSLLDVVIDGMSVKDLVEKQ